MQRRYFSWLFIFAIVCGLLTMVTSCNSDYTAKPRGYYKIDFPEKKYQVFDQPGYPYSFEYPVYANITKDTTFFDKPNENPWWININYPQFGGRIYVSYISIDSKHNIDTLIKQSFELAGKHTSKAYSIEDTAIATANDIHGVMFTMGGNTATANQFFLTDTVKHYLRGALYFDATPNEDSLRIVNNFLLQDMKHLINTFRWRN